MNIRLGVKWPLMNEAGADGGDAGGSGAGVASTSDAGGSQEPSGLDFGALMDNDGEDLGDVGGGDGGAPAPVTAPAAAAPATQEPAPATAPAAVAPVVAPATEPPAASSSAAEPQVAVNPDEQQAAARTNAYEGLVGSWKQTLTPEVVEQVMTDPAEMLPQLMAQVELRALETTMAQVMRQIPAIIKGMEAQQSTAKSLQEAFFGEFPQLAAHEDAVVSTFMQFQQLPGFNFANPEHRAQLAGAVAAAKKIALGQAPAPAAAAPAARPSPSPMGSSAAPAAIPGQQQPHNVWAALAEDDIYPE